MYVLDMYERVYVCSCCDSARLVLRLDTRDGEHVTCEHVSPVKCPEWALRDLVKGPFVLERSRAFNQRRAEEHVSGLISHLVPTGELEQQVDRSGESNPPRLMGRFSPVT